eukprot:TRINITY_DN7946_c0_g1_i1.p1 TRINITY_DN7946_c0_g1~~TRINITY_DN7946_c0_g1_i1.p1  ORF type:complete len:277 (-),score=64.59 TRINITY_DN7946_c0_g1_i1:101-931(-)
MELANTTTMDSTVDGNIPKKPSNCSIDNSGFRGFLTAIFPPKDRHVHRSQLGTANWLRAAVLGSNDAIVSVSSVMVGVAANSDNGYSSFVIASIAALVAGALSMAVGEYVSVCSQKDMEEADLKMEKEELLKHHDEELEELAAIYEGRGLTPELAKEVATQLMAKDPLQAHAMDELGIHDFSKARPFSAAMSSFICFLVSGSIPLLSGIFIRNRWVMIGVVISVSVVLLILSGILAAHCGGSSLLKGASRVGIGGLIAIGITFGIGFATELLPLSD